LYHSLGQRDLACSNPAVNPRNFFAELKRRNVIRMAGLYLVGAWLLTQVASTVLPTFDVPSWALRGLIITLVVGFFPTLIFCWVFELTPQGLQRDADVRPEQSIAPQTARRMDRMLIVVLALALAYFGFDKFVLAPRREAALVAATAQVHTPSLPNESRPAASARSIAVLPFENLSEDKNNAYFAEGVQDEILTRLAKVADLKVISRTSTQRFKSAPDNLRAIAQQLGVANILEGSVQKANDQVRVNVQLINAITDAHLWADIYDRKLTDIFAVESDIAKTIADTLQAKLSGPERTALAKAPTSNNEAYELYLRGRFFWNKRTGDDLKKALDYFNQAAAADPNYAAAYAGQADAGLLIPIYSAGEPREYFPKAKAAARRAIELDETSAEGHTALAQLLCITDLDFVESEKEFVRALQLNPNYATAHHWFGNSLLTSLGRFDEAIKEGRRSVELDPLSLINNADFGSTFIVARRYDEAIEQLRRTVALDNSFSYAHWNLGQAFYLKGNLVAAIAEYEKSRALDNDPDVLGLLGRAYAETGRKEQALKILKELNETAQHHYVRRSIFALVYIGLGEKTKAMENLEQSFQNQQNVDLSWIKVDPLFDPLRGEPRFKQLVAKVFPESPR
jgi:TolB-like protein/Tfp pilus assembly protein PilF